MLTCPALVWKIRCCGIAAHGLRWLRHSTSGTAHPLFVTAQYAVMLQLRRHLVNTLFCIFCSAGLRELAQCCKQNFADLQPLETLPTPLSTLSG